MGSDMYTKTSSQENIFLVRKVASLHHFPLFDRLSYKLCTLHAVNSDHTVFQIKLAAKAKVMHYGGTYGDLYRTVAMVTVVIYSNKPFCYV